MTPRTTLTVAELLERYAAGERDFSTLALDMGKADFDGAVLDGADLSGGWFHSSRFQNASLRGTVVRDACLKCCDFTGADLSRIDFTDSALDGGLWKGAVLTGARFGTVELYGGIESEDDFIRMISTPPYES